MEANYYSSLFFSHLHMKEICFNFYQLIFFNYKRITLGTMQFWSSLKPSIQTRCILKFIKNEKSRGAKCYKFILCNLILVISYKTLKIHEHENKIMFVSTQLFECFNASINFGPNVKL